jgi:AcrR family transcriptional regulator
MASSSATAGSPLPPEPGAPRAARGPAASPGPRARAAALPAEARRRAIIGATVPLLLAHGTAVTTRQIAEAAGVAEGTIFRVFPDKDAVIDAAVEAAFDPEATHEALRAIDRTLPLEERLLQAIDVVQRRMAEIWQLMAAVGHARLPEGARPGAARPPAPRHLAEDNQALADVIGPDADRLRCPLPLVAATIRGLIFGATHPAFAPDGQAQAPRVIVDVLLHGILDGPDGPAPPPGPYPEIFPGIVDEPGPREPSR